MSNPICIKRESVWPTSRGKRGSLTLRDRGCFCFLTDLPKQWGRLCGYRRLIMNHTDSPGRCNRARSLRDENIADVRHSDGRGGFLIYSADKITRNPSEPRFSLSTSTACLMHFGRRTDAARFPKADWRIALPRLALAGCLCGESGCTAFAELSFWLPRVAIRYYSPIDIHLRFLPCLGMRMSTAVLAMV